METNNHSCHTLQASLQSTQPQRSRKIMFFSPMFIISQNPCCSPVEPRSPEWHLVAHSRASVLLARLRHLLGEMMKHSAGGTWQCGKWSKGPDVLSSGRSSSASLMDGPPSLPGMLGLLLVFLIISLFFFSLFNTSKVTPICPVHNMRSLQNTHKKESLINGGLSN